MGDGNCSKETSFLEEVHTAKCSTAGPDFCHKKYDQRSFCDPSTASTQQLGDGCSCPFGAKADAGKCSGGGPSTYFCKHGIQVNACGKCSGDADCGNVPHACWGFKDGNCPKETSFLEEVHTAKCSTAGPDFCHTKYDQRSFCDPTTKSTQQLGDGCSCPFGAKADEGKCSGGGPSTYFCKHGI